MMRSLILLSVFAALPAFAIDLKGSNQSSIEAMASSIDGKEVKGFGGIGGGVGPFGMVPMFMPTSQVKLDVQIMQNATVTGGKFTTEAMSGLEASKYVENVRFLNDYIKQGGEVNLSANPSSKDLSLQVQKLTESNDVKVVRRLHAAEIANYKKQIEFYQTTCKGMGGRGIYGNGGNMDGGMMGGGAFGDQGRGMGGDSRSRRSKPAQKPTE